MAPHSEPDGGESGGMDMSGAEMKTVVLRNRLDAGQVDGMVLDKKASMFGSAFGRPKPEEVHVHSLSLVYDSYMVVSGLYRIDFYRKATHKIEVDGDVVEIIVGGGTFPVQARSGIWDRVGGKMKAGVGMDGGRIELEMEEHVKQSRSGTLTLDQHGNRVGDLPYGMDPDTLEGYPDSVLEQNGENVRRPEVTLAQCFSMLRDELRKTGPGDIRVNSSEMSIEGVTAVYVPVYEARCVGPKRKVAILRIDGVTKKVLG